jgi:hypothetical protein
MQLDVSRYKDSEPTLKRIIANNIDKELDDILQILSISTGIHILGIAYMYGNLYGFTEELNNKIKSFQNFYSYVVVINPIEETK